MIRQNCKYYDFSYASQKHYCFSPTQAQKTDEDITKCKKACLYYEPKPKVYIAGAISNCPNHKELFAEAHEHLSYNNTVLDPTILPIGLSRADYMRICFAMIDTADKVYFLSNYKKSEGAMLEYQYCKYIGKDMEFEEGKEND
jgi:hypothetical protein